MYGKEIRRSDSGKTYKQNVDMSAGMGNRGVVNLIWESTILTNVKRNDIYVIFAKINH